MSHPKISTKFPNFMTITRKNYSGSLCFHERSKKKNVRIAQIYTDFTLPLVQSSAKPGKGMPGSGVPY